MTMIPLICAQCGKGFERKAHEVNRRKALQVFCSRTCQLAASTWHNPKRFQRPTINEMLDTDAAWLAALIDGEGSIIFPRESQGNTRHEHVRITINMAHHGILLHVQRLIGHGYVGTKKKREERYADQWTWSLSGPNAAALLMRILPWLIIKRARALKGIGMHFTEDDVNAIRDASAWEPFAFSSTANAVDHWDKADNAFTARAALDS